MESLDGGVGAILHLCIIYDKNIAMSVSEKSVLLFKPDSTRYSVELRGNIYLLHEIGRSLLVLSGLEITEHITKCLQPAQVQLIYERALAPNPEEDAIYGTQWKVDVVNHMSSAPVEAYFVYDKDYEAEPKTKSVKNFLHRTLTPEDNVVENIAYVPDEDEYSIVREILLHEE